MKTSPMRSLEWVTVEEPNFKRTRNVEKRRLKVTLECGHVLFAYPERVDLVDGFARGIPAHCRECEGNLP